MRSVQNFGNLSILWNFQPSSHAKLERQWEVQMSEPQVKSRARAVEHWNTITHPDRGSVEHGNKKARSKIFEASLLSVPLECSSKEREKSKPTLRVWIMAERSDLESPGNPTLGRFSGASKFSIRSMKSCALCGPATSCASCFATFDLPI